MNKVDHRLRYSSRAINDGLVHNSSAKSENSPRILHHYGIPLLALEQHCNQAFKNTQNWCQSASTINQWWNYNTQCSIEYWSFVYWKQYLDPSITNTAIISAHIVVLLYNSCCSSQNMLITALKQQNMLWEQGLIFLRSIFSHSFWYFIYFAMV